MVRLYMFLKVIPMAYNLMPGPAEPRYALPLQIVDPD